MAKSICNINKSSLLIILAIAIILAIVFIFKRFVLSTKNVIETLDMKSLTGLIDFTQADPNIHPRTITDPSMPLPLKPYPTTPGCWYINPTGCPKKNWKRHSWLRDTWGEEHASAGLSAEKCAARQNAIRSYCGNKDSATHFVPGWKPVPAPAPTNPTLTGNWKTPLGVAKITQKPDGTLAAVGVSFPFAVTGKFNADNPLITTWNFAAYGAPILEGVLVHSVLPAVDQKTKLNQINWSNGAVWTKIA